MASTESTTFEDVQSKIETDMPDFIYLLDNNSEFILDPDDTGKIKQVLAIEKNGDNLDITEWINIDGSFQMKKKQIKLEVKDGKYHTDDSNLKEVVNELNKVSPPTSKPKVGGKKSKSKKRRRGGSGHKGKQPMSLTYPLPRTKKEVVNKVTEIVDLGEKAEALTGKEPTKEGKARELSIDEFGIVNRGELHADSPEIVEMGEKVIEDAHARGDLDTAIRMGTMHLGTLENQGMERENPEFKKVKSALVDIAVERNQKRKKEARKKKKSGGNKTKKKKKRKLRTGGSKSSRATKRV